MSPTATPTEYRPPLVISVHGILTAARWQKTLGDTLGLYHIAHRARDFGRFGLFRFASNWSRQRQIDAFYEFYGNLVKEKRLQLNPNDYQCRPSVIAHSFGSYIIGYAMQKYPDIKFDKIILCGSILPTDFDWSSLFHRDQVNLVRNEYGCRDFWTTIVARFIRDTGPSGTSGFNFLSTLIDQERFEYFTHSDYFRGPHVENYWLPFLMKRPSPLIVQHGRNMADGENTFTEIFEDTGKIDELCFSQLAGYGESEISMDLLGTWIGINPDIYTFLYDRLSDKVRGYVNAIPVSAECFDKIKAGRIRDNQITGEDVIPFMSHQRLKLYLLSVAIDPALRRTSQGLFQEPFERLMNGFVNKLIFYAVNRGIRITEMVSVGWTGPGRKLCEAFGMDRIGADLNGHPIYWLDLTSRNTISQGIMRSGMFWKLLSVYDRMGLDRRTGVHPTEPPALRIGRRAPLRGYEP